MLLPAAFFTVRVTVYFPAFVYLCVGLFAVEVLLSPKFQDQEVGEFLLLSVNCTCNVAFPDVGDAEKAATGFVATGFVATGFVATII